MPAILGGAPVFEGSFKPYITIGEDERKAVIEVLDSGMLSGFIAGWMPEFYGGTKVQLLEREWEKHFSVSHAIAMNSATSCLYAAIGAAGIEPGDEVITTPTTMTASVTGIVVYQGIPIFADICPRTFCINPINVERLITERTKAIVAVNIYGHSADWDSLRKIADRHKLVLIEDAAQSIGGKYGELNSGTLGDIGIFSLNRHKHIHCGEGGLCVTDNSEFAERLRLIRNHGEAVVDDKKTENITNIIGFNYRMTEIEAAIAVSQLKKLDSLVDQRRQICEKIIDIFASVEGIEVPKENSQFLCSEDSQCKKSTKTIKHTYYYLPFKLDEKKLGMTRSVFVSALQKEGIPLGEGGYKPVYLQSMYQKQIAYGSKNFPFKAPYYRGNVSYNPGLCPVAERMWFKELFYFKSQSYVPSLDDIEKFSIAINKVLSHKKEINSLTR
jgi:dTDP-4-amino-4,6-dideoxygalactose transaminase